VLLGASAPAAFSFALRAIPALGRLCRPSLTMNEDETSAIAADDPRSAAQPPCTKRALVNRRRACSPTCLLAAGRAGGPGIVVGISGRFSAPPAVVVAARTALASRRALSGLVAGDRNPVASAAVQPAGRPGGVVGLVGEYKRPAPQPDPGPGGRSVTARHSTLNPPPPTTKRQFGRHPRQLQPKWHRGLPPRHWPTEVNQPRTTPPSSPQLTGRTIDGFVAPGHPLQ